MSRAGVADPIVTMSLLDFLPALLRTDDLTVAFMHGLDEVLAPIVLTIDGLGDYVDPDVAPVDFLEWLASWFGLEPDPSWSEERTRTTVKRFARLQLERGTAQGLADLLATLVGREVDVDDGGGVWVTLDPNAALEGRSTREVIIRGVDSTERARRVVEGFVPQGRTVVWA